MPFTWKTEVRHTKYIHTKYWAHYAWIPALLGLFLFIFRNLLTANGHLGWYSCSCLIYFAGLTNITFYFSAKNVCIHAFFWVNSMYRRWLGLWWYFFFMNLVVLNSVISWSFNLNLTNIKKNLLHWRFKLSMTYYVEILDTCLSHYHNPSSLQVLSEKQSIRSGVIM